MCFEYLLFLFSGIKKERTTVICYFKLKSTTQMHAWSYWTRSKGICVRMSTLRMLPTNGLPCTMVARMETLSSFRNCSTTKRLSTLRVQSSRHLWLSQQSPDMRIFLSYWSQRVQILIFKIPMEIPPCIMRVWMETKRLWKCCWRNQV